jgi:hypothetical protein
MDSRYGIESNGWLSKMKDHLVTDSTLSSRHRIPLKCHLSVQSGLSFGSGF